MTKSMDESIAEIRRVLVQEPTTNRWWELVSLVEGVQEAEREVVSDYVVQHVDGTEAWKRVSVPCGAWAKDSLGWSLSSVQMEPMTSYPEQKMVWCPAGKFTLGSPDSDEGARDNEKPAHEVTLTKGFWMGQMPVTQGLWESVMGNNPSRFSGESDSKQRPVETVSWYDAMAFCNALSKKEGLKPMYRLHGEKGVPGTEGEDEWTGGYSFDADSIEVDESADGYRLPTEAQWEYSCRAGTVKQTYAGDLREREYQEYEDGWIESSGVLDDIAWYDENSDGETHAVGQKQANAWGLHDMLGNVTEWCWDWYGDYNASAVTDPVGDSSGSYRVSRGGSWYFRARNVRSASRGWISPGSRNSVLGFRLVRVGP